MIEKVIEPGLSGHEMKLILVDLFKESLDRDCFFAESNCYQRVSGNFHAHIQLVDVGSSRKIEREIYVHTAELPGAAEGKVIDVATPILDAPENQLREEAGLPIPVESRDENGRPSIKHVKYAKKSRF